LTLISVRRLSGASLYVSSHPGRLPGASLFPFHCWPYPRVASLLVTFSQKWEKGRLKGGPKTGTPRCPTRFTVGQHSQDHEKGTKEAKTSRKGKKERYIPTWDTHPGVPPLPTMVYTPPSSLPGCTGLPSSLTMWLKEWRVLHF